MRNSQSLDKIESEYIKNLQQQVYFLELEANFLYPSPLVTIWLGDNLEHKTES